MWVLNKNKSQREETTFFFLSLLIFYGGAAHHEQLSSFMLISKNFWNYYAISDWMRLMLNDSAVLMEKKNEIVAFKADLLSLIPDSF